MCDDILPAPLVARLQAADPTYAPVGGSAHGPVDGFGWLDESRVLTRRDFEGAVRDLMTWQLQRRSGLRVRASETPLVLGTVMVGRLGLGPVGVSFPCRVVEVIDEPDRRGFAYGTLPGHPEGGEERFVVERRSGGEIVVRICAFSRPASLLARVGGPVTHRVQAVMTQRYLRALDRF